MCKRSIDRLVIANWLELENLLSTILYSTEHVPTLSSTIHIREVSNMLRSYRLTLNIYFYYATSTCSLANIFLTIFPRFEFFKLSKLLLFSLSFYLSLIRNSIVCNREWNISVDLDSIRWTGAITAIMMSSAESNVLNVSLMKFNNNGISIN